MVTAYTSTLPKFRSIFDLKNGSEVPKVDISRIKKGPNNGALIVYLTRRYFLRLIPTSAIKAEPNNQAAAGTGTCETWENSRLS